MSMIVVKVGTMSAGAYRQVKRAPRGAWYSVVRGAPKPGDIFAVEDKGQILVLLCTRVEPDRGPLYFGTLV